MYSSETEAETRSWVTVLRGLLQSQRRSKSCLCFPRLQSTTFQLIHSQHSVGNRICSHRIDTGADIIVIVWHTFQSIEFAGNLLVCQLFRKVLSLAISSAEYGLFICLASSPQFIGQFPSSRSAPSLSAAVRQMPSFRKTGWHRSRFAYRSVAIRSP